MSRVSKEYGEIISKFLKSNGLTFRAAAFASGLSAAYWKDMSDGRVPSEEAIARICAAFDTLDENELRTAGGYSLKSGNIDAVRAVEFALRGNQYIPDEGKKQILKFVKKIEKQYIKQDK